MHFGSERLISFQKAYEIFKKEFYRDAPENQQPYLCTLHDAFKISSPAAHNCLGCNFADLTTSFDTILYWLPKYSDIFTPCSNFILWLYLFVERYEQIMERLSVPDGYKKRHFKSFQSIRRWSNFIKHPKAFLFTHHPEYVHEGEVGDDFSAGGDVVTINQGFIDTYYAGSENNSKLYKTLSNAASVIVVFPDPEAMMERFAADTKKFVSLIQNNEVYREELAQITTIEEFFVIDEPEI